MSHALRFNAFAIFIASLICACSVLAQDPLNQVGLPAFATPLPVELGFLDVSNGNLHQEITLGSFPQRGARPFVAGLIYDSRLWKNSGTSWGTNGFAVSGFGGWRSLTSVDPGSLSSFGTGIICGTRTNRILGGSNTLTWNWIQADGLVRQFQMNVIIPSEGNPCHVQATANASAFANDSSGFHLVFANSNETIYAPDGTQVFPNVEDTNGNFFGKSGTNVVDTLGRIPVTATFTCNGNANQTCYDVLNSQGGTSRFTVTMASIPVSTAFGVSGVKEFSGTINVIQSILLPDGNSYTFTYDSGSTPGHYGLLTSVTLPTGGVINYGYSNFTDALGNTNRWVTSHTSGGGTWTYTPTVGVSCATGGSTCTQTVATIKPSGDETDYDFTLNNGAWNSDVEVFSGTHASGRLLAVTTNAWDFSQPCSPAPCTGASNVRKLQTQTTLGQNGDKNIVTNQMVFTYADPNTTNLASIKEWKFVAGVTLPATPDRETDFTYLATSAYTAKNILNRVLSTTVKDGAGNVLAQTNFSYDDSGTLVNTTPATGIAQHDDTNFGIGDTVRGNLTKVQRCTTLTSCSSSLSATMSYDTTGHPVQTTDSAGNVTTMGYADNFFTDGSPIQNPPAATTAPAVTNAYLTSVTVPLVGTSTFGYYFSTGKPAASKDQNGADSFNHFLDPLNLDRLTNSYGPVAPNGNRPWALAVYAATETQVDSYSTITDATPSPSCVSCMHGQTLTDNLGRMTTQILVSDPEGATTATTSYDTTGRLLNSSHPFRTTSDSTYGLETPSYDGLGRVTKITHADGSVAQTFYGAAVAGAGLGGITTQLCSPATYGAGFPTLSIDEAGKKREFWTGGFGGSLIELDEPDASGNLTVATCYSYDLFSNLLQTTHGSQTRSVTYDALSRVTSVTAPETGTTGSHTINNFYTSAAGGLCSGNPAAVCRSSDPRGITKTFAYDALNRLTGVSYSDTTPAVSYFYDQTSFNGLSIANGKGRRTGMSDASGSTAWSYDLAGHILIERRTIAGITKTISYAYNLDGSIATVTYPSGRQVNYTVSNAQRLTSAKDAGTGTQYAITASYAAIGALQGMVTGQITGGFAGNTETHSYNNRLEYTSTQVSSTTGTALNLSMNYNLPGGNNGSVASVTNNVDNGRSQTIQYDPLNRITSATSQATAGADCWGQSFGIDALANLTAMNVTQCTAGSLSATANANNQLTSLSYDATGNTTGDGAFTYAYDAENRVTSAAGVTYTYDGNGLRVEKSSGTLYWRSLSGDVLAETDLSGNTVSEYVFFAGRRVSRLDGSGNVFYYFPDPLGNTRTIADASGNVCYDADFTPYGQEIVHTNTCPQNYKFTGYERDPETGNDYAFARYYNPRLGRFLSVDPLGGSLGDSQSLNRYAYVVNNPMNLIDPSGLCGQPSRQPCKESNDDGNCNFEGSGIPCSLLFGFLGLASGDQFGLLQAAFAQTGWMLNPDCPNGDCPPGQQYLPVFANMNLLSLLSGFGNAIPLSYLGKGISFLKTFSTSPKSKCSTDLTAVGLTPATVQNDANTVKMVNALTNPAILAKMDPNADFAIVENAPVPTIAYNSFNYWQTSFGQILGTLVHEYAHLQNPGPSGTDSALINSLHITNATNTNAISMKFATDCFSGVKNP